MELSATCVHFKPMILEVCEQVRAEHLLRIGVEPRGLICGQEVIAGQHDAAEQQAAYARHQFLALRFR